MSKEILKNKIQAVLSAFLSENENTRGDEFEENEFVEDVHNYFQSFVQNPAHQLEIIDEPAFGHSDDGFDRSALYHFKDKETGTIGYAIIESQFECEFGDDKRLTDLLIYEFMTEEEFEDKLLQQRNYFQSKPKEKQFMTLWSVM